VRVRGEGCIAVAVRVTAFVVVVVVVVALYLQKKLKKSVMIAEICTPHPLKKSSFPRGSAAPYHTITQLLLLSDKNF
jgi:hypothetical protein